jgi:hypothetical protein
MSQLYVEGLFDSATSTISYIVMDAVSKQCALVDSVLDYDPKSGRTSTASADRMVPWSSGFSKRTRTRTTCPPRLT